MRAASRTENHFVLVPCSDPTTPRSRRIKDAMVEIDAASSSTSSHTHLPPPTPSNEPHPSHAQSSKDLLVQAVRVWYAGLDVDVPEVNSKIAEYKSVWDFQQDLSPFLSSNQLECLHHWTNLYLQQTVHRSIPNNQIHSTLDNEVNAVSSLVTNEHLVDSIPDSLLDGENRRGTMNNWTNLVKKRDDQTLVFTSLHRTNDAIDSSELRTFLFHSFIIQFSTRSLHCRNNTRDQTQPFPSTR